MSSMVTATTPPNEALFDAMPGVTEHGVHRSVLGQGFCYESFDPELASANDQRREEG